MISKLVLSILFCYAACSAACQSEQGAPFIDPTGAYKLVGKTKTKNGDTYGYFGDIKVKLVTPTTILVSFYVCKGAPSYNSGSFTDTLNFENNEAIFRTGEDVTCQIVFQFRSDGVDVIEKTADYNSGCGFGHAVIADGFYRKTASKVLEIKPALSE